jgi:hypothetical protein
VLDKVHPKTQPPLRTYEAELRYHPPGEKYTGPTGPVAMTVRPRLEAFGASCLRLGGRRPDLAIVRKRSSAWINVVASGKEMGAKTNMLWIKKRFSHPNIWANTDLMICAEQLRAHFAQDFMMVQEDHKPSEATGE